MKYLQGTFVSVANSTTVRRPPNVSSRTLRNRILDGDWLAYILEIRASDEHHVYARVCWLYQPEDLPRHQHRGQRCPAGRQPYHGADEVIASNHSESRGVIGRHELTELPVDIINVITVTGAATVRRWDEENDNEVQQGLYWRQIIDIRQRKLSVSAASHNEIFQIILLTLLASPLNHVVVACVQKTPTRCCSGVLMMHVTLGCTRSALRTQPWFGLGSVSETTSHRAHGLSLVVQDMTGRKSRKTLRDLVCRSRHNRIFGPNQKRKEMHRKG